MTASQAKNGRRTDGVLLLDKPVGMSSQLAVTRVKALLAAAKAGHTGTLDPMAGGLLPVCLGEATKFSHFLLDADKTYYATVRLGLTTSTGDLEGEVTGTAPVRVAPRDMAAVLERFIGTVQQIPPMYSAIKHAGKPLYRYARAGMEIERRPRAVRIHAIESREFAGDELKLSVRCGKGTYIRVLAEDIGRELGCGACLSGLVRTAVGDFQLDASVSMQQLEELEPAARSRLILPVDSLVKTLARVDLDAAQASRIKAGRPVALPDGVPGDATVRVYGPLQEYLGVAVSDRSGTLSARRLMSTAAARGEEIPAARVADNA